MDFFVGEICCHFQSFKTDVNEYFGHFSKIISQNIDLEISETRTPTSE